LTIFAPKRHRSDASSSGNGATRTTTEKLPLAGPLDG
jgi:hypothetical protein